MSRAKTLIEQQTVLIAKSKEGHKIWTLLLFLTILPFLLLAKYNTPSIHDNYLTANAILRGGRINYIINTYQTWSGRYTELVLKAYLDPLTYQHSWLLEKLGAFVITLLFWASIYWLLKTLEKGKVVAYPLANSLLLFSLFINGLSSVGVVFYWFDGYTAYTAGIIACLVMLNCIVATQQQQRRLRQRILYGIGAVLAMVVAVGTYEIVLLATGWLVGTRTFIAFRRKQRPRGWWLLLLGLWLVCAYIALNAPGNFNRADNVMPDHAQLFSAKRLTLSTAKSVATMSSMLISWTNSLLLLFGTIILLPAITQQQPRPSNLAGLYTARQSAGLLLWIVLGLSACILPSILVYQTVWERTWQCVYAFFLLGWVYSIIMILPYLRFRYTLFERALSYKVQIACRIIFVVVCIGGHNTNTNIAYMDLQFRAPEYQQRVLQRVQSMQRAHISRQSIRVTPVYSTAEAYKLPKALHIATFNENDAFNFARYYGIDAKYVRN